MTDEKRDNNVHENPFSIWDEFSKAIREVVNMVGPAVVSINPLPADECGTDSTFSVFPPSAAFSGVIFNSHGYILTSAQAVTSSGKVSVRLVNGRTYYAIVMGKDESLNLAVLKIMDQDLPCVKLSKDAVPHTGDFVLALGNPFGLSFTVSAGIISGFHKKVIIEKKRIVRNIMQTDASINQTNIGGPLINHKGEIIGISVYSYKGIGLAVNVTNVQKTIEEIILNSNKISMVLGISAEDVLIEEVQRIWFDIKNTSGVKIRELRKSGIGAQSGLLCDDVIVGLDTIVIEGLSDLRNTLHSIRHSQSQSQEVFFHVLRGKELIQIKIIFAAIKNN